MTLTAPGGISNSSSRPFSNLFGRIALDNYNRVEASESLYDFNVSVSKNANKLPKKGKLTPRNVFQVIASTGLVD